MKIKKDSVNTQFVIAKCLAETPLLTYNTVCKKLTQGQTNSFLITGTLLKEPPNGHVAAS